MKKTVNLWRSPLLLPHRIPAIALLTFLAAAAAGAQSLPQQPGYDAFQHAVVVEPRPYEFEILGVKPGMPIDEAVRLIEEHLGKELSPLDGTLQISSPDGRTFRTELRLGYETPGITFFLRNQDDQPFDSLELDVSTPASGSVVTAVRREVRLSASDGPDGASLLAQLEDLYGEPSETKVSPGTNSWLWATDMDYSAIPFVGGGPEPRYACVRGLPDNGRYSYEAPFLTGGPNNCGATFGVSHRTSATTVTLNFRLTDYKLVDQDREAANSQVDEKLSATAAPSDMKL